MGPTNSVILNRTKRRRILQALLPLLAFVWATLPALPCCHVLGGTPSDDVIATASADQDHSGHHGMTDVPDGLTIDHGANHCEEGTVSDTDPPCTDIQKTSNDLRPIHFATALIVVTSLLPVPDVVSLGDEPIPDPSPPPRHRPLHLEKSVLLI